MRTEDERTLFVYHLPPSVDDAQLRSFFAPYGVVARAEVKRKPPPNQHESKGFAFVAYSTRAEGEAAKAALHGCELEGARMALRISFVGEKAEEPPQNIGRARPNSGSAGGMEHAAKRAKIYNDPFLPTMAPLAGLGNASMLPLPPQMPVPQLSGELNIPQYADAQQQMQYPELLYQPQIPQYTAQFPGQGALGYDAFQLMQPSLQPVPLQPGSLQPGLLSPTMPKSKPKPALQNPENWPKEASNELFIFYIPQDMRDPELHEMFVPFGPLKRANVVTKKGTEEHKGFGFVTFEKVEDAVAALQGLHGKLMSHGKELRVTFQRAGSAKKF